MKSVFLIGYMGAGKTTLGRALARRLGAEFIDLDLYIERRFRHTINELFAERGEDGFRRVEQAMLHEVGEFEGVVVACGGGTPCFFDNMAYMNTRGVTIFLDVDTETLHRRLRRAADRRPLLHGMSDDELRAYIQSALATRLPYYTQAQERIDAGRLESRRQIAETLSQVIEQLTNHT